MTNIIKTFWPLLALMLMLLGCGKKTTSSEEKKNLTSISPTEAEIEFRVQRDLRRAVETNKVSAIKELFLKHPELDIDQILSDRGDTLLILAVRKDHREVRDFLIERGAQINRPSINLETPLMAAIQARSMNSLLLLLDLGVDLEKKDINGDTALHLALKKSNDEMALQLIKHGANLHEVDGNNQNALRIAESYNVTNSQEVIRSMIELEQNAPDIKRFKDFVTKTDLGRVKMGLARYPNLLFDKAFETVNLLEILIRSPNTAEALKLAEIIIDHGISVQGHRDWEHPPLIEAIIKNNMPFVELLLKKGADIKALSRTGRSALIHAVEVNSPDSVSLILSYGGEKKYHYNERGVKRLFDACETSRLTAKRLQSQDLTVNKYIRSKLLECRSVVWPF